MECDVKKQNLGLYKCYNLPQMIKGMIWTPDDFRVPVISEDDIAFWQAAIFDPIDRIFYWPPFVKFELLSTEAVYEDNPLSLLPVLDGQYRYRAHIRQNMCVHRAMYSHRGSGGRIMLIDTKNNILGTRDANGEFMGVQLAMLHTEKLALNSGTTATTSPIFVVLEDSEEIDQFGDMISGRVLKSIIRIVDVEMKKIAAAAGQITVDVKVKCDGTPVVGLIAADFIVQDPDGTVHAITSVTPDPLIAGRYAIAGAGFLTNSTVTLRTADQLSLDGYEHPEPLVVTF